MVQDRDFKTMLDEREAGKTRGPPASSHFAKMQNSTVWGVKPNFMGEDKDWVMPKDIPKAKTNDSDSGEVHKSKKDRDSPTNTSNAAARGEQITDLPDSPGYFNSERTNLHDPETGEIWATRGGSTNKKKKKRAEKLNPSKNPTQKIKKADDIKEPDETQGSMNKGRSPLDAEGLVKKSDDSAFGTEMRPFKDMMVAKAGGAALVEGEKYSHSYHPELSAYANPDNPNTDDVPVANNIGVEETYRTLFEPEVYAEDLIENNKRADKGDVTSDRLVRLDEEYGNPGPFQSNQWYALQNSVDRDSDEESKDKADKVAARKDKKKVKKSAGEIPLFRDVLAFKKMQTVGQMTGLNFDDVPQSSTGDVIQTNFNPNSPNSIYVVNDDLNKKMVDAGNKSAETDADRLGGSDEYSDAMDMLVDWNVNNDVDLPLEPHIPKALKTDLAEDRLRTKASKHNDGKEHVPRGKIGKETVGDRKVGVGPVSSPSHNDSNIQATRKDHTLPIVTAEYNLPKGQYSPSGRIGL